MKLEELLRHVADNVEAGKPANHDLLYWGRPSIVDHISCFNWTDHDNYSNTPKTHNCNGHEVPAPECAELNLTEEPAIANTKAMLGINPYGEGVV
jgi:hypothetical protein